ncbi:MAG: glycosyltransferase, partial [Oligoflexales bacterium]|nr:glycosyltransferase [Oligoflexales bacterium]
KNPQMVHIAPNGIDSKLYVPNEKMRSEVRNSLGIKENEHLVMFSGSRHGPNNDALSEVRAFERKERDLLARLGIYFLIVGSVGEKAEREGRMIVTGPVPEVLPYFSAADFAFNPVKTGSGSNVKIFEYIAATLPVISTSFGTRGTTLKPSEDYYQYETNEELAEILKKVSVLSKPDMWKFAERVWQTHKSEFDMTEIIRFEWEKGFFKRLLNKG